MTTQEILEKLKYNRGVFPRQALQEAVARRDEIIPALLKVIEDAKLLPEAPYHKSYMAHIYAMYLLAQFREKRAYPLIVEFFSIPGEFTLDCTGDVVTEDLHRILASVSHGDATLIKSLVANQHANEYVRSAAIDALATQVACGEANREEVMAYYQSLFRGGIEREHSHVWNELVSCCTDLHPGEVIEDIRQAFEQGLVHDGFIDSRYVMSTFKRSKESVLLKLRSDTHRQFIQDAIKEIEWWACFKPLNQPEAIRGQKVPRTADAETAVRENKEVAIRKQKVGRNEPCPCGSGKKYKKCCGFKQL